MKKHFILILLSLGFASEVFSQNEAGWLQPGSLDPQVVAAQIANVATRSRGGEEGFQSLNEVSEHEAAASLGEPESLSAPTPTAGGNEADEITPEILELARGLHYDPLKIFEYVYNYIEFEPYYGSKKGAHLTLLEGSGNDFDQCSLLVALLRASGKNPTYQYGACDFSYGELTLWMGLSVDPYGHLTDAQFTAEFPGTAATLVNRKLKQGIEWFFDCGYYITDPYVSGGEVYFSVPHVWVELDADGDVRKMSPSFKPHDTFAGIDLNAATGYSRAQILNDAGGTVSSTPDSATDLEYGDISSRLASYTQALKTHLKDNEHETEADLITGTRRIRLETFESWADLSPIYPWAGSPWLSITPWTAIPVAQMSKLQVRCGTYNYNATTPAFTTTLYNKTINMPGLRGRKISLSWSGNTATLRLDEAPLGDDPAAASFTVTGGAVDVQLTATHNHYYKNPATLADSMFGRNDQKETKPYLKGDTYGYAFVYAFDNPEKLSRVRQEILDGYLRSGLDESDWEVRTETLNIMGLQWYDQTAKMNRVVAPRYGIIPMYMHRFGRVAQEGSYYIDVGLQNSQNLQRTVDDDMTSRFFHFASMVHSAMEHSVIEQMQGEGKSAASTVKMLHLANQAAIPVYRVNAANWSAVNAQLINYGGAQVNAGQFLIGVRYRITVAGNTNFILIGAPNNTVGTHFTATGPGTGTGKAVPTGTADLESAVNATVEPALALVPKDGQITIDQWKGGGYAVERFSSSLMKISGGYFGGYNSILGILSAEEIAAWFIASPAYTAGTTPAASVPYTPYTTPARFSHDPVDMLSGSFVLDKTELTIGSSSAVRGLSFSRHYNSNRRFDKSPGLGYGWTHNYDISLRKRTSVTAGLGGTISYHAVPFYTAMLVASDLYETQTNAKEWLSAALVINWGVDRLKYNAVSITTGNRTVEFILLPDGSYEPPAGMNLTLTAHGTGANEYFTMEERNGSTHTFDTSGRIASITDLWGKSQTFTYTDGHLASVADGYGRTITFTRDSNGRIDSVSDTNSRTVGFTYTVDDLTGCTDVEGKTWTYAYDADHRMTTTRDPSNRVIIENTYDTQNRVSEQLTFGDVDKHYSLTYTGYCNIEENPQGGRTCYLYDKRGRSIATADPLGNTAYTFYDGHDRTRTTITPEAEITDYYYDKDNNLTETLDPIVESVDLTYDALHRVLTATDKRGNVTTFDSYNAFHQPLSVTAPLNRTTLYSYTATGEIDTMEDAEGNVTDNDYNSLGQLTQTKLNGQVIASYTYNAYGDTETSKDGLNRTTTFTYNKRRQLLTTTLPPIPGEPPAVIAHTYDNEALQATTEDANGNITSSTYSPTGKPLTQTLPALAAGNNVLTHTYDSRDWPLDVSDSLARTTAYTHDAARRLTATSDPLNRITTTEHDANGRPLVTTDPLDRTTAIAYTARSEPETLTDALLKTTGSLFDANGNHTHRTNRRGKTHVFTFDSANRQTASTTPTGKATITGYFDNDLVESITEPSTQQTAFTYDTRLRPLTKADPVGTVTYGYNNADQLTTVTEGVNEITRTYDERGRLKTYTNADGDVIQYRYDVNGNLTRLTYPPDTQHPTGKEVNYTYNARNLLESVTDWDNRTTTYIYDRVGRLTGTTRPNGTANIIAHDAANQLTSIKETAGGKLISYLRFDHDDAGQIERRFRAPLANSGWQHPSFAATYDDDNRIATINGQSVTHDDDGNMTYGPIREDSGLLNLSYNSRNQLTGADGITYIYDAEGNRRALTDSGGTTRFTIDTASGNLLIKHNPDGSKTYYVHGLGLLYEADETGVTKTHHYDQVGSTIARTDDSGKVIGKAEYSAFGITFWKQGDMGTPFLYNGQAGVQTDANGLLNMRARYYSPYLMRFLNADPIGFGGGSNWFAYADGNPISMSDPFGLEAAQNDFFGQVMDRINGAVDSMWSARMDPNGAAAAGLDRIIDGGLRQGSPILAPVEPFKAAGAYQEGSHADHGGDFMAAYYTGVGFAAGASSALGAPRNSVVSAGGMRRVTSWAETGTTPDLNPGRWVQLGDATRVNFWRTGLPGGKVQTNPLRYESSNVPFTNSITGQVPASSLRWPSGWEKPKGILGQRQINGGAK